MKRIIILFVLVILLSACKAQPNGSTSTESYVSLSTSLASDRSEITDRPLTQKIPAFIEGGKRSGLLPTWKPVVTENIPYMYSMTLKKTLFLNSQRAKMEI